MRGEKFVFSKRRREYEEESSRCCEAGINSGKIWGRVVSRIPTAGMSGGHVKEEDA